MSNERERYTLALSNLVNRSELGYEDVSSIPQYKKDIEDYVDSLEKENQELHNKIDKAIEYINDTLCCIHDEELLDDLLEILKDSDVDE